jgi:hypothetical protein
MRERLFPASANIASIDVFLPWSRASLLQRLNDFRAMPQYRLAQNPGIFPSGAFRRIYRQIFIAMIGMRQSDFIYSLLRLRTHIKSKS